jgi:hypothetical protein
MKRSLLLLDLWSRCGLRPRLHLGLRGGGYPGRRGHAWLTRDGGNERCCAEASATTEQVLVLE